MSTLLVHESSLYPYLRGIAIVAIEDPFRDALVPRLPAEDVHVPVDRLVIVGDLVGDGAQVDELGVPLHADLEAADLVGQAHDLRAAPRRQVQDLVDAQLGLLALVLRQVRQLAAGRDEVVRHQLRLPRRLEDARAVAAAHVGAEADLDALLQQPAHAGDAAREGRVAAGAVGDLGPARGDEVGLVLGEVDGVGEDHLVVEEAVGVVHVGVAPAAREELAHEGDLAGVLRDVRLHGQLGLRLQGREAPHGLGAAGGREARRQDGAHEREAAVEAADVLNGGAGRRQRVLGRLVDVVIRAEVIHTHAPDEGALAHGEAQVG